MDPTFTIKYQLNVGKYTIYMDPKRAHNNQQIDVSFPSLQLRNDVSPAAVEAPIFSERFSR